MQLSNITNKDQLRIVETFWRKQMSQELEDSKHQPDAERSEALLDRIDAGIREFNKIRIRLNLPLVPLTQRQGD
jgi:hypothetical protein